MWILNICEFASASENGALILYFTKLESIVYIFVFVLKISRQSKNPPLLPFVQPHPFYKKYFIPTLIAKLEEVNAPFL